MAMSVALTQPGKAMEGKPKVAVVTGRDAPQVERYAAEQLCGYLRKLFGVTARPTTSIPPSADRLFLIGSPATNSYVGQATSRNPFPTVSDQGLVLRRVQYQKRPALLVGGGSPEATLWAVGELVERWGVRYLLHGDVLPERKEFRMPDLDVVMEPALKARQWRVINDFACGPESWGMADYRPVLDQLAKLKFNRIFASVWCYQPFLHLEFKGIKRKAAYLWFDAHYPITEDMPGRQLFGKEPEFWNPDLPLNGSYEEFAAAGQEHVHQLMTYAKQRGMKVVMDAMLTEFPPEFAPLLKNPQKVHQFGEMGIVPGPETEVEDPALTELAAYVLQTTVNTYPEVDYLSLGMPEFRQWSGQYERAWKKLDARYAIEKVCPLAKVMEAAHNRTTYPGGADRAVMEAKGDIVALYFYDRLINDLKVLKDSRRPDVKFLINSVAEELFPVLPLILLPGSETLNFVDYTPSRIVKRRSVLKNIPGRRMPCSLIYTLHDDNVGVLPQLTTGSLHTITKDLFRYGWEGFSTRYWLIGDHDPCVAYLSKASWERTATPDSVYRDQVRSACGEACVEDMLTVFREVETTTVSLEDHGLGLTFPVPGMIMKFWEPTPMSAELEENRAGYQRALQAALRARGNTAKSGRGYVDYWIGRLEFGIGYLSTIETVKLAATAEAAKDLEKAADQANEALRLVRAALEAYARVARDQSDRGAIAVMNEYVYRPLKAKVEELKGRHGKD